MLKGHHDKDDDHHFTRETGQHYSIEISSCYNLRFEELEGTSEIFCPSLLLINEELETRTTSRGSDWPKVMQESRGSHAVSRTPYLPHHNVEQNKTERCASLAF